MAEIFDNSRTSFYAWMSEDDSLWPEGSFLYWQNIEPKRFAKFVELAKAPQVAFDHNDMTSVMRLWAEAPNPLWIDWIFFLWDDGKIVRDSWSTLYTESGGRDLKYHAFNIWDAFYFTASWGASNPMRLNKILHSDIDSNWAWDVSEDILSWDPLELIESWFSSFHRVLVVWTIAYISSGNKIAKFNHNTWVVEAQFDFFNSDITWITYWAWNIKVFLKNGLMYLWDGVNEEQPLDIVDLWEKTEIWKSIWAIEYVIWWDLWGLNKFFALDGRRLTEINSKQHSRLLQLNKFDIVTWSSYQFIDSADNQIYLIDRDETVVWWAYRIASYWNKLNWLPKWYSVDVHRNSVWNTMWLLTFIFITQWKLFYWFSNSSVDRWVDYVDLNQPRWPFASEWFIVDNLFDWWDIIAVKKEEKLYWKCEIPAWTSIEILQSVNWSDFVTCKIIDENTKLNNWVFTLSQTSFDKTNYREVSYKPILRTTDPTKSPKWFWFKTKYSFTDK